MAAVARGFLWVAGGLDEAAESLNHLDRELKTFLEQVLPPTNSGPNGQFDLWDFLFKGMPGLDPNYGKQPPGRASGGRAAAGTLYEVNENRREFFRPDVDGQVIPLGDPGNATESQLALLARVGFGGGGGGGGGPIVVNHINLVADFLTTPSSEQIRKVARQLVDEIDELMQFKADNAPVSMPAGATRAADARPEAG